MEIFYKLIEVAVTLIEDTIIISSVVAISGRRYAIKKHVLGVWVSVVAMSLAVSGLNRIEMFSFFWYADRSADIPAPIQRITFASGDSMCHDFFCYPKYRLYPFYRNGAAAWKPKRNICHIHVPGYIKEPIFVLKQSYGYCRILSAP